MSEPIPFLDLVTPHRELENELLEVVRSALRSAHFIGGSEVEEFERDFARFCDVEHCVAVNSGTDALRFALIAAGIPKGSVVLTAPNTFIATTEAISQAGARFDFVDVDERTYNLDAGMLRNYLETRCTVDRSTGRAIHRETGALVSGVVPVHLYGRMADMDAIVELAERYRLTVIEDACQAHGAEYRSDRGGWRRAGSVGRAAAFSFYPGKNLGACGDAGAVTTGDPRLAATVRMLRDHGQSRKYHHDLEGYNGRLDAIQAGFLRVKLRRLEEWNERRRALAGRYADRLGNVEGVTIPSQDLGSRPVHHLYVVRVPDRERVREELGRQGIGTGLHYPVPLYRQQAYSGYGFPAAAFPVAEKTAGEILSLPMGPHLADESVTRICDALACSVGLARRSSVVRGAAGGERTSS
jgi:dTDP-4-amino-4,6-dideoxygalactose transaminase